MQRFIQYFSLLAGLCLAFGPVACSDDDTPDDPCGNGVVDTAEGEVCDGADLGGASCSSLGYSGGDLACAADCTYDESTCTDDCGNDSIDGDEECDGADLGGETCESQTGDPGTLGCNANCTFDTSDCGGGVCGNGSIEGAEECDLFELGGTTCADLGFEGGDLACTVGCSFNTVDCYNAAVMDVGAPCTDNTACNGGVCLTEVAEDRHWGPAGGYCYENCDANSNCPLSGQDGVCVEFTSGAAYCMESCDLAAPACRPGFSCEDVGGVGVCFWGHCDDDAQCEITGDCDTDPASDNEGWCVTPEEDCSNGIDDDLDGKIDCGDTECTGDSSCPLGEICGNNVDDDGDGYADCDDAECGNFGLCTGEVCTPPAGATLTCGDILTGEANDAAGSTNVIEGAQCQSAENDQDVYFSNEWGPEYAYVLTVTQPQEVTVTVSNYAGDLDIYIIKEILGGCDPRNGCFNWGGEGVGVDEVMSFTAYPGMNYYVVVDGFQGNVTSYDISVACASTGYEDCGNGVDDDNDTLVDCLDPECFGVANCSTETDCGNGFDDDLDGAMDCADTDCAGSLDCSPGLGYWEMWDNGGAEEVDLEGYSLMFTADAMDAQGYTYATSTAATWSVTPGTGDTTTALTIADEDNASITLPFAFPFQGQTYTTAYVTDDGYISFVNEAARYPGPSAWNIYQNPRIAALWGDQDPATGSITYDEFTDHVAITWDGLLNWSSGVTANQFQMILWDNGDVEVVILTADDVANLPGNVAGYVTMVGALMGTPPAETNFLP